jgi:hypothetical protein
MQKIDTPLLTALPQPSMSGVHSWHDYNTLIHSFRFLNIPCPDSSTARTDLGLQTHASDLDCSHIIWSTQLLWRNRWISVIEKCGMDFDKWKRQQFLRNDHDFSRWTPMHKFNFDGWLWLWWMEREMMDAWNEL